MMNFPKVFLGGLPSDVNETQLRHFFSKYGKASPTPRPLLLVTDFLLSQVVEVVIMYNQERKSCRGNGFRGETAF
jgi:RNA-binding protein Musashi